jgi:hypothetical protein
VVATEESDLARRTRISRMSATVINLVHRKVRNPTLDRPCHQS